MELIAALEHLATGLEMFDGERVESFRVSSDGMGRWNSFKVLGDNTIRFFWPGAFVRSFQPMPAEWADGSFPMSERISGSEIWHRAPEMVHALLNGFSINVSVIERRRVVWKAHSTAASVY